MGLSPKVLVRWTSEITSLTRSGLPSLSRYLSSCQERILNPFVTQLERTWLIGDNLISLFIYRHDFFGILGQHLTMAIVQGIYLVELHPYIVRLKIEGDCEISLIWNIRLPASTDWKVNIKLLTDNAPSPHSIYWDFN